MNTFDFFNKFTQHSKFHWDFLKKIEDVESWNQVVKRYDLWLKRGDVDFQIPKIIHQIWLGSPLPKKYKLWCESWVKYNPNYKYILWDDKKLLKLGLANNKNYLATTNLAAKSDIARYEILKKFGGVYVDTDFECFKSLDDLLHGTSFFVGQAFHTKPHLLNSIIGSSPNHPVLNHLIASIKAPVIGDDFQLIFNVTGPNALTRIFMALSNELPESNVILPSDYFYPWPNFLLSDSLGRYNYKTENSYGMHHWEVSWLRKSFSSRISILIKNNLRRFLQCLKFYMG